MKNLMGGRHGDEKYRLGGGGGLSSSSSSSCSSSPSAHHEQLGSSFPVSYYSSSSSPSSSNYASLRDMEMMRAGLLGRGIHIVQEQDEEQPGGSGSGAGMMEKEHMFDKVVTPSDVGKLNRLVIPKQHAEKYFPLDSSTNEKGLLLNFEDRSGKPWRFRYSYWNSSQSYVMTKGWSRFVKEKKLDAGDIVSFQRGMGDAAKDRLFIDWRRPHPPLHFSYPWAQYPPPPPHPYYFHPPPPPPGSQHMSSRLGNPYEHHHPHHVLMNRSGMGVVQGKAAAAAKRMRLFGVNISTTDSRDDEEDEANILSSTALPIPPAAATDRLGIFLSNSPNPCSSSSMSLDLDI